MSNFFCIISYYEHITGICDIKIIKKFSSLETASAYFQTHHEDFIENNPLFYTIIEEKADGFYDSLGNRFV